MGNAKATKLYRDRQSGKSEPLKSCPKCGKQVRSSHDGLCSRCWYKTEEGKRIRQKGLESVERTKRAKLAYSCQ